MSSQFSTRFEIDMGRPGHCDLLINNITVTDAGTYECLTHSPVPDRPDRSKQYVVRAIQLTVLGKNCMADFTGFIFDRSAQRYRIRKNTVFDLTIEFW